MLCVHQPQQGVSRPPRLQDLTSRLTAAVRGRGCPYLPWSPLTGLGRASDHAAAHPAFAIDAESDPRFDA